MSQRLHPPLSALLFLAALMAPAAGPGTLSGQIWEDPVLPRGRVELAGGPTFSAWSYRFGLRDEGAGPLEAREPLAFDLTEAARASRLFPGERALREALGGDAFQLSLGVDEAVAEAATIRLPFRAAVGVTSWLTVGVNVPFVRRRFALDTSASPDSATAGITPVLTNPGGVDAFLSQFSAALAQAASAVEATCADLGEGDPACLDGRATLAEAETLFRGLSGVYLGSPVFALEGSSEAAVLQSRVEAVQTALAALGAGGFLDAVPTATSTATPFYLRRMMMEPASGIAALHGEDWLNTYTLGDVEITADFRVLDWTFGSREARPPVLRTRLRAGVLYRLGTGAQDAPEPLVGLGSFDGQNDLELRFLGDLDWTGRLGVTADLRLGQRSAATGTLGWEAQGNLMSMPLSRQTLRWEPGGYWNLRVAPRLTLTEGFSIFADATLWDAAPDVFTLESDSAPILEGGQAFPLPALDFLNDEGTEELVLLGGGMSYSTLAAHARGAVRIPVMIRGRLEVTRSGAGGRAPDAARFSAEIRVFRDFWGGS